jgi:hypothetical protein
MQKNKLTSRDLQFERIAFTGVRLITILVISLYFISSLFIIFFDSKILYIYIEHIVNKFYLFGFIVNGIYASECLKINCDYFLFQFKYTLLVFLIIFIVLLVFNALRIFYEYWYFKKYSNKNTLEAGIRIKKVNHLLENNIKYKEKRIFYSYIPSFIHITYAAKEKASWQSFVFDILLVLAVLALFTPLEGDSIAYKIFSLIISYLIISISTDKLLEIILTIEALFINKLTSKG